MAYQGQNSPVENVGPAGGGVSPSLRMPLYHQIYLVLRQKILGGELGYDDRLSSELDLAGDYGVSRVTTRRALKELAADGLVVRSRSKGTRVRYRQARHSRTTSKKGLLQNLLTMDKKSTVTVEDFRYLPATDDVAQALDIGVGDIVQKAIRIRHFGNGPFSILITHVPQHLGKNYHMQDLEMMPLLRLLDRSGITVAEASQSISATLADAEMARLLDSDVGMALVDVRRIVSDGQGRPVIYSRAIYRPDRYQYQMTLSKIEGEEASQWSSVERVEG